MKAPVPTTTPKQQPTPPVSPDAKKPATEVSTDVDEVDPKDLDSLSISTSLVSVPVIATTAEGTYIPDLSQEEFSVTEDGERQQISFFATVSTPFNVVL